MTDDNRVDVEVLATVARRLAVESDLASVQKSIVDVAVAEIDGADCAGITTVNHNRARTTSFTDHVVRLVDRAQYEAGQGPCLTAVAETAAPVQSDDLATDARWPVFGPRAATLGIRSALSFRLYTSRETLGSLNVYAAAPNAFNAHSRDLGAPLAAHAALAIGAATARANFQQALRTRDVIGQAKGILMERCKVDEVTAFATLVATSQRVHRKLREVAEQLASTGELPG